METMITINSLEITNKPTFATLRLTDLCPEIAQNSLNKSKKGIRRMIYMDEEVTLFYV